MGEYGGCFYCIRHGMKQLYLMTELKTYTRRKNGKSGLLVCSSHIETAKAEGLHEVVEK